MDLVLLVLEGGVYVVVALCSLLIVLKVDGYSTLELLDYIKLSCMVGMVVHLIKCSIS